MIRTLMLALCRFAEEQLWVMFYTDKAVGKEALTRPRKGIQ